MDGVSPPDSHVAVDLDEFDAVEGLDLDAPDAALLLAQGGSDASAPKTPVRRDTALKPVASPSQPPPPRTPHRTPAGQGLAGRRQDYLPVSMRRPPFVKASTSPSPARGVGAPSSLLSPSRTDSGTRQAECLANIISTDRLEAFTAMVEYISIIGNHFQDRVDFSTNNDALSLKEKYTGSLLASPGNISNVTPDLKIKIFEDFLLLLCGLEYAKTVNPESSKRINDNIRTIFDCFEAAVSKTEGAKEYLSKRVASIAPYQKVDPDLLIAMSMQYVADSLKSRATKDDIARRVQQLRLHLDRHKPSTYRLTSLEEGSAVDDPGHLGSEEDSGAAASAVIDDDKALAGAGSSARPRKASGGLAVQSVASLGIEPKAAARSGDAVGDGAVAGAGSGARFTKAPHGDLTMELTALLAIEPRPAPSRPVSPKADDEVVVASVGAASPAVAAPQFGVFGGGGTDWSASFQPPTSEPLTFQDHTKSQIIPPSASEMGSTEYKKFRVQRYRVENVGEGRRRVPFGRGEDFLLSTEYAREFEEFKCIQSIDLSGFDEAKQQQIFFYKKVVAAFIKAGDQIFPQRSTVEMGESNPTFDRLLYAMAEHSWNRRASSDQSGSFTRGESIGTLITNKPIRISPSLQGKDTKQSISRDDLRLIRIVGDVSIADTFNRFCDAVTRNLEAVGILHYLGDDRGVDRDESSIQGLNAINNTALRIFGLASNIIFDRKDEMKWLARLAVEEASQVHKFFGGAGAGSGSGVGAAAGAGYGVGALLARGGVMLGAPSSNTVVRGLGHVLTGLRSHV